MWSPGRTPSSPRRRARPSTAGAVAQFSSYDLDVPEVGTELAAARALRQLADRLLQATSDDLEDLVVHEVHLVR